MYAPVDTLPDSIRRALQTVRYGRRDISIEAAERTTLSDAGSAGQKAFVILVNLESGQTKTTWGSWGGPNMFNPRNPVDLDTREYPIPDNGAVIQGSVGNSTYARVLISPSTIAPLLPKADKVPDHEARILYCYVAIKGGQSRRDELAWVVRKHPGLDLEQAIEALISNGYLKRNKAGATQVTTEGKNAYQTNPLTTY